MEELLHCLDTLQSSNLPNDAQVVLNSRKEDVIHKILALSSVTLITEEGHNVWEHHERLSARGFRVFPGEVDSFGWVTGCIQTTKGVIVYG